jgi:hypothetical protein
MVARRFKVSVYESRIAFIMQEGDGNDWLRHFSEEVEDVAWAEAPKRSGELADSHQVNRNPGTNQYIVDYSIENFAEHASYVHRGTLDRFPGPPWIKSTRGYTAWLTANGEVRRGPARMGPLDGFGPPFLIRARGQRANEWLDRAGTQVALRFS